MARAVLAESAFAGTIAFYALVALPLARRELAHWHTRAEAIADPDARELALTTVRTERLNSEGAAAFAVLNPLAARRLIPLLVAYQLAWDFVDTVLERGKGGGGDREAVQRALEIAVTPGFTGAPARFGASPSSGFLRELVGVCQTGCALLPSHTEAGPALQRVASRSDALLVTNDAPEGPTEALRVWALRHSSESDELEPTELCAAAHCSLGVHALLATASRQGRQPQEFDAVEAAYFPWIGALCTLLDSFVDLEDDERTGDFSFVTQYPSAACAAERVRVIAETSLDAARALPEPGRHMALLCALVGMYVSMPAARAPRIRPVAEGVLDATAPLSRRSQRVLALRRMPTRKMRRAEIRPWRTGPEGPPPLSRAR